MKSDERRPGILPPLTPAQRRACQATTLAMNAEGQTAIVLETSKDEVKFLPMDVEGIFVTYTSPSVFRARFPHRNIDPAAPRSLRDSNVAAAARCYVSHATLCGADQAAVEALEALVPITPAEKERIRMVSTKKTEAKKPSTKKKDEAKEAPAAAKAANGKKDEAPARAGAKQSATPRKDSVASVMKELIMRGGLTDDQIFAETKKRCPQLTPDKRSYVAWYRNDLKKKGENPPAPKKELKAS